MASIWIRKKGKNRFCVTVDEYPEISFTASSYEEARDRAVDSVMEKIRADRPKTDPGIKEKKRISFGFAA